MKLVLAALAAGALAAVWSPVLAKPGNGPKPPSPPPAEEPKKPESGGGGAITLLTADCNLLDGCEFSGNDKDGDAIAEAYEKFFPSEDLSLDFVVKIEFEDGLYSGTWTSTKPVSFLSVKSAKGFMLYQLPAPATSGVWSTAGLTNKNGVQQAISHLTLWSSDTIVAVPEPTTWAMMILGFGGVGAALRRLRPALAAS